MPSVDVVIRANGLQLPPKEWCIRVHSQAAVTGSRHFHGSENIESSPGELLGRRGRGGGGWGGAAAPVAHSETGISSSLILQGTLGWASSVLSLPHLLGRWRDRDVFTPCLKISEVSAMPPFALRLWKLGHVAISSCRGSWEVEPNRAVVCVTLIITEEGDDCLVSTADSVEETV